MDKDYTIRKARLDDSGRIAALCGPLGYPVDPAGVRERLAGSLADPHQAVFVADSPDGVTGSTRFKKSCRATGLVDPTQTLGGGGLVDFHLPLGVRAGGC